MFQINTEFQAINQSDKSFIEQYVFDHSEYDQSPQFLILIKLKLADVEAEEIADVLTETFRRAITPELNQESDKDAFTTFEDAIKIVNETFQELLEAKKLTFGDIVMTVAALIENELLIAHHGEAESYLVRGQHVSTISETSGSKKELFENISCGQVEDGDKLIFATERLLRYIIKTELPSYFSEGEFKQQSETLAGQIKNEALSEVGIICLEVKATDVEAEHSKATILNLGWLKNLNFIPGSSKKTPQSKTTTSRKKGSSFSKPEWVNDITTILTSSEYRTYTIIASIAILLIIGFIIYQGFYSQNISEYQAVLTEIRTQISEAQKATAKTTAADILKNAEQQLTPLLSERSIRTEAHNILNEINTIRGQFDDVTIVEDPTLIGDLAQLSEDPQMKFMFSYFDDVIVANGTEIATVLVDSIKTPTELSDTAIINFISPMPDSGSIIALLDNNDVIEYRQNEVVTMDIGDDLQLKPATDIEAFGTRLYVLDNTSQQIWRYSRSNAGLSEPEGYLDTAALPESKDITIDGSIYALTENNQLIRYFGGKIDNFQITNQPLSLPQNPSKIYTNEQTSLLYMLDPLQSKIFVYFKNGQTKDLDYLKQYQIPSLEQVVDFAIQTETKKLYVTDGAGVYVIPIE